MNLRKICLILLLFVLLLAACAAPAEETEASTQAAVPAETVQSVTFSNLESLGTMPLQYATEFSVNQYSGGYSLISVTDGLQYFLIPEGAAVPEGIPDEICVLQQPLDQVYMAATSAMDLYRSFGGLDAIRFSCLKADGWYIPEAREAMERGEILYAGKYSAPDYELIFGSGCDLAVESTMIYHTPEVKEQLERLGIPVFVERSSYEKHPLGRMEWMKLHALLLGRLEEAETIFQQEMDTLTDVLRQENTGKTVAFFAINANGTVTVRKTGDYIAKTIALAGGEYVFGDLGDDSSNMSTVNLQMEAFYAGAKDADVLIYNSTLNGELQTIEELLQQSPMLAEFKAVQDGNVWCTGKNLFQEGMGLGRLILEMNQILNGGGGEYRFVHRLT